MRMNIRDQGAAQTDAECNMHERISAHPIGFADMSNGNSRWTGEYQPGQLGIAMQRSKSVTSVIADLLI